MSDDTFDFDILENTANDLLSQQFIQDYSKLSPAEKNILIHKLEKHKKRSNKLLYRNKEQALVWVVASDAYLHMLEFNKSAKECLEYSARKHYKDIDKVFSEKSKPCGSLPRKIAKEHDDHPIQKDMIRKGYLNKQSIANSKSVWHMLNTLSTFREAYETLIQLENKVKYLQTRQDNMDLELQSAKSEISHLKKMTGSPDIDPKDKAKYLNKEGFSKTTIAEHLGVNRRTVTRWLRDE